MSVILEALISKTVEILYESTLDAFKEVKQKLKSSKQDIQDSLNLHLQATKNWSEEISFSDLKKAKSINEVYVDLDLYIYPKRVRISLDETITSLPLKKVINKELNHILLLGQPGSGKTTTMKYLCNKLLFNNETFLEKYHFPILIKLREYNQIHKNRETGTTTGLIVETLYNILGLQVEWDLKLDQSQIDSIKERIVLKLIDSLNILLIFDGFDEIAFANRRETILKEITLFSSYLENSKLLVTSRTADFSYSIEKLSPYEICSLNESQIYSFANRWLRSKKDANKFVLAVNQSPFADTAIRPLTIAHLCAIYERIGNIPEKPKTVYKKIINLLLEEWDGQRNIKRESKYANFEIDRKFEFLCSLAYQLTTSLQNTLFSRKQLENIYIRICYDFDLLPNQSKSVVSELESHTGLFIQSGYDYYEFAHKSLQEYLTAEYIVKLPSLLDVRLMCKLPNEIAIAITISSNPSRYFVEFTNKMTKENVDIKFVEIFLNRLLLEKPDFNQHLDVIFSALNLYSMYLSMNFESQQLRLFVTDALISQFEGFIKSILKRNQNSLKLIEDSYDIKSEMVSDSGFGIILLERKSKTSTYPARLYCRDTFLLN